MIRQINEQFEIGKCYFRLGYHDRNLTIPFVEPYFYLGIDVFGGDAGYCFFQKAELFLSGEKATTYDDCGRCGIIHFEAENDSDLVDWTGLVNELAENKQMQDQGKFLTQKQ